MIHELFELVCVDLGGSGSSGLGFAQAAHKLLILVQLLRGEVPERALFLHPLLNPTLGPLLPLTRAVISGDMQAFSTLHSNPVLTNHVGSELQPLLARLHQNVIRMGLKRVAGAYCRISLPALAARLTSTKSSATTTNDAQSRGEMLVEDAQYAAMKAIRDGVLPATAYVDLDRAELNFPRPCLSSRLIPMEEPSINSVFSSAVDSAAALELRIVQAQGIRREAMAAMSYPDSAYFDKKPALSKSKFSTKKKSSSSLNVSKKGDGKDQDSDKKGLLDDLDNTMNDDESYGDGDIGMDDGMGF